ncbi:divergent PAP2 family protein [Tumidithrix helvetica PCC 7403]
MLHPVGEILDNNVLLIALSASISAQLLKLLIDLFHSKQLRVHLLFETGGMPSSHSALVSALATGIGRTQGWDTPQFAIATVFAFIVMYDAAGIRLAAGKQAKVLNQIIVEVFEEERATEFDPLKELLGHTPMQVLMGAILGVLLMWCLL